MVPPASAVNLTPSSSELSGPPSATTGTVRLGQSEKLAVLLTLIDRLAVAVREAESVTLMVKLLLPVAVGLPEIAPELLLSERPAGSAPEMIDQVYGVDPPEAVTIALYAAFLCASGNEVVLMVSGAGCTVMVVLPVIMPNAAEIVLVPGANPAATPVVETVAVPVLEEAQCTLVVMSCVLPSELFPVAVICKVDPELIVGLTGVTVIEVSVGGGAMLATTSTQ